MVITLNVAVTDWLELIVTEQVDAVPEQAPPQPANTDPEFGVGVAVSVTAVPDV
jgi:hypothetical protein